MPSLGETETDFFYQEYAKSPPNPEDFRLDPLHFNAGKQVEQTKRFFTLQQAIEEQLNKEDLQPPVRDNLRKKLLDLLIFNCHGRIFSIPNSCSDFIPVVDDKSRPELKNQLAVILHKDIIDGEEHFRLAFPGGYNDFGESVAKTTARELKEELGAETVNDVVFFGEASAVERGGLAVSALTAGLINPAGLMANDDAEDFTILNVLDEEGNLNTALNEGGKVTGASGKEYFVDGFRDDHWFILIKFHEYWSTYGRPKGLSFQETLRRMSSLTTQEWFKIPKGEEPEEHSKTDPETGIKLTPNIRFALSKSAEIMQQAGIEEAKVKASQLVACLVKEKVLPEFPQVPVTVDCLIIEGDNLVAIEDKDGILRLPGSFFAPEEDDFGETLTGNTKRVVAQKTGIHFRPAFYLGCVGGKDVLGKYTDPRGPRLTHVFVGQSSRNFIAEKARQGQLPEGTKVVRIPIFNDQNRQEFSEDITDRQWAFSHNREILIPFLSRFCQTFDPEVKLKTCEDILIPLSITQT